MSAPPVFRELNELRRDNNQAVASLPPLPWVVLRAIVDHCADRGPRFASWARAVAFPGRDTLIGIAWGTGAKRVRDPSRNLTGALRTLQRSGVLWSVKIAPGEAPAPGFQPLRAGADVYIVAALLPEAARVEAVRHYGAGRIEGKIGDAIAAAATSEPENDHAQPAPADAPAPQTSGRPLAVGGAAVLEALRARHQSLRGGVEFAPSVVRELDAAGLSEPVVELMAELIAQPSRWWRGRDAPPAGAVSIADLAGYPVRGGGARYECRPLLALIGLARDEHRSRVESRRHLLRVDLAAKAWKAHEAGDTEARDRHLAALRAAGGKCPGWAADLAANPAGAHRATG